MYQNINPKITLGQAYINKDIIKKVGKATNKYPNELRWCLRFHRPD